MSEQPCYKENSLEDFAAWAKEAGHYVVAPLIKNYEEFVSHARTTKNPSIATDTNTM
jgi:hypothetical protein